MNRFLFAGGAIFALTAVITRALSSHAIREFLAGRDKLDNFNLASDYLLVHGLALIVTALLNSLFPQAGFARAGVVLFTGSLLFQGSVLIKSCIPLGAAGIVTPAGGAVLMVGWLLLLISGIRAL